MKGRLWTLIIAVLAAAVAGMEVAACYNDSFYKDFWPNFLSEFIVGAVLGSILAWWISRQIAKSELEQERAEEARNRAERAILYLEILREDISYLYPNLTRWLTSLKKKEPERVHEPITSGAIPRIEYRLWNVVQSGGELPGLVNPNIVRLLTLFYGAVADARQSIDWALEGWKLTDKATARARKFGKRTQECMNDAVQLGEGLVEKIDQEIERLKQAAKAHERKRA